MSETKTGGHTGNLAQPKARAAEPHGHGIMRTDSASKFKGTAHSFGHSGSHQRAGVHRMSGKAGAHQVGKR